MYGINEGEALSAEAAWDLQLQQRSQTDWTTATQGLTKLARNGTRDPHLTDIGTSCASSHSGVVESALHRMQD